MKTTVVPCCRHQIYQSWPWPPQCIKMTRRSPDERLRKAADCLGRLRGLRPDLLPMPPGSCDLHLNPNSLFEGRTGPGIEPVGGEFQPSFAIVHPGGGAHLFPYDILFSYSRLWTALSDVGVLLHSLILLALPKTIS
jgi:hypothetical protein